MKNFIALLFLIFILGCEEEFSIQISEDFIYGSEWKLWEKTIQSKNTQTGKINTTTSRDIDYRIIFADDVIQRITQDDKEFRFFPTLHLSLDSIVFQDTTYDVKSAYDIVHFFGRKKTVYDEKDSSSLPFYTYLKLENKEKFYGENQVLTEFLLLYKE